MDTENHNPFREGLVNRAVAEPCALVIFGATGDLTRRKLIPALYNLAADGNLPSGLAVVCFARRDKTNEGFRAELGEAARKYSRRPVNDELWARFPTALVNASEHHVGLPDGQMGNSEVGHLNMGAGRVVYQDFA
ncbi:MAG: hypothetical protein ACO3J2_10800, partial [Chthoniobacterales bacterium]